jgi:hypothetical protein
MADLVASIDRLRETDPDWLRTVEASETIRKLKGNDLYRVVESISTNPAGASFAAELLERQSQHGEDESRLKMQLALALIGTGKFADARDLLGDREALLRSTSLPSVFNYACAEWGETGTAPVDLFSHALQTAEHLSITVFEVPNLMQCLSMASYVCGKKSDAAQYLRRAERATDSMPPGLEISCWRFLNVTRAEFKSDLEEMQVGMKSGEFIPRYMRQPLLLLK